MNNWSPSPITCNETRYDNVEQGYQHKKVLYFKADVSALKIIRSGSQANAFKIGQKVEGLINKSWGHQAL